MINGILQFIKRLSFARRLARFDSLFVLEGFSCFRKEVFLVRPFVRKSPLPAIERLRLFLNEEDNDFLYALAEEVSVRSDLTGGFLYMPQQRPETVYDGETVFKTAGKVKDAGFYLNLLKTAAGEKTELRPVADSLTKRLDSLLDMRFYGAALETISEQTEAGDIFSVDWIRTSKDELVLSFRKPCRRTQKLNKREQQVLVSLFGKLLFDRSLYVSFWSGVLADSENNVAFACFDGIFEADSALKNFARNQNLPQTENEFRLHRAMKLLAAYCPQINIAECWAPFFRKDMIKADLSSAQKQLSAELQKYRVIIPPAPELHFTDPKNLAGLLDSSRHRRDPRFRKSTIYYWGPLLIAAYLLFKYF